MHRRTLPLLLLAFLVAGAAAAQDAPVRYDADMLPPAFHEGRRAAVLDSLPTNAVALFFSAPARTRENDVEFEYRQDSDLFYLTGTHEPGSVLLLAPGGVSVDGETVREVLFVPPSDPSAETWLGRRFGVEGAQAELGVEKAVSNERFAEIVAPLLAGDDRRLYHLPLPEGVEGGDLGSQLAVLEEHAAILGAGETPGSRALLGMMFRFDEANFRRFQPFYAARLDPDRFEDPVLKEAARQFASAESFEDWQTWRRENLEARYADGTTLRALLTALRMVKTDAELALLQRAIDITEEAQKEAMRSIEPGMYEYEVEALIEYVFKRNGAAYPGFPSIVGSGENSVILHYNTNRRRMEGEDLVVMDIGAEYHGYTADVTRTVPVDGSFSPEERAIYELVLRAQEAGIAATRAGNTFGDPDAAARQVAAEGLKELGLIESDQELRNFFLHGTSHYLGLYVHDVGTYGELLPGTVITVEPGLYIRPSTAIDEKWWNIGVRIEDDVLVTDGDPVVLSAGAPRTVEAIEALMRERGLGNTEAGLLAPATSGQ